MTQRKKLAIVVVTAPLAAGVAVFALRGESLRGQFEQLQDGMTYDEVVAILGEANAVYTGSGCVNWREKGGQITGWFDSENRLIHKSFHPAESRSFLDRVLTWFGL